MHGDLELGLDLADATFAGCLAWRHDTLILRIDSLGPSRSLLAQIDLIINQIVNMNVKCPGVT